MPLARLWPAHGPLPARIVVYRRPVETISRGADQAEVVAMNRARVAAAMASVLPPPEGLAISVPEPQGRPPPSR